MRTFSAGMEDKLTTNTGTEPILLVEVEWVTDSPILYSDKKVSGADYPYPKILDIGGFDSSMMLEGASDSQQINVTLDDSDGSIKQIYNSNDIHHKPVKVYLIYDGINLSERGLLFQGELVTPFDWDEAKRSVTFTILSQLEATEVGFSMEEGNFPNIPEEALGKPWPLVFGQVCNMPAVQVRAARRGFLVNGEGIHDFTLNDRLCQASLIQCPAQSTGNQTQYTQGANNTWNSTTVQTDGPDQKCVQRRGAEICKLSDTLDQQLAFEHATLNIREGSRFPQNQRITLNVEEATFDGSFNGDIFTILSRTHPDFNDIGLQTCTSAGTRFWSRIHAQFGTRSWGVSDSTGTHYKYLGSTQDAINECDQALQAQRGSKGGPVDSWANYQAMESSSFFWAPSGTEVYMEGESEVLYIVSLIPGTVDRVTAYREMSDGTKLLMEVPTEYYTVQETDYQGYDVVELSLVKKLSLFGEGWDDQVYVSFTSDVGPNPVDIIEWLITKYTPLAVDSSSFTSVHSYLTKYPCNFYLLDRRSVYQVIQDVAYQSRCQVFIRNRVVYLVYLSLEPDSLRTVTESDVLLGSFQESLTDSEDVYTTHKMTWKKGGARLHEDDPIDFKIVLKYNVGKYGTRILQDNYYTENIFDIVLKSSTFWLIRKSNMWKKITFTVPMRHMDLDVTDCITVDVSEFSSTPVKCIIEKIQFSPSNNTIKMTCWTPLRMGETEPYYWAWPSQQPATATWPLPGDTAGGGGLDFEVTPPADHILLGGSDNEDQLVLTTGDKHPSDLDDTTPLVYCEYSDYFEPAIVDPEINPKVIDTNLEETQNNIGNAQMENQMTGGPNSAGRGASSSNDEDDEQAACCDGSGCAYYFYRYWHMSTSQVPQSGGCDASCPGGVASCGGPIWSQCVTYGSLFAVSVAHANSKANGKSVGGDHWDCMETSELIPGKIYSCRGTDPITGESCPPPFDDGVYEPGAPSPQADTQVQTGGVNGDQPEGAPP